MATKSKTTTRESAPDRLKVTNAAAKMTSAADLRKFFKACDLREKGHELEWEEHLKTIEESRS
jgi:hypothetical protein